jgi:hypothetical protein
MTTPPASSRAAEPLVDPLGRVIRYVRVSVTDRCDLRCIYCMAERQTFLPREDLLSIEDLDRLAFATKQLGVAHAVALGDGDVEQLKALTESLQNEQSGQWFPGDAAASSLSPTSGETWRLSE